MKNTVNGNGKFEKGSVVKKKKDYGTQKEKNEK